MRKSLYLIASLLTILVIALSWGPIRKRKTLILAHNLDVKHPVHEGIAFFAQRVDELSQGELQIKIYPNGQLGSEREVLEQLQLGAVSFSKVSSLSLESFSPLFGILNTPFLFRDEQHYYRVLDSSVGDELLAVAKDKRILGLTYYNGGTRSFYASKPILKPSDLKGMKLRVMGSQTAIRMTKLLGGSPTPMPYGEIYTALQQGVIDGAENNVTALTLSRHGEVAQHYSVDQHIMAPDILLMSTQVWNGLEPKQQKLLREAAQESKLQQRNLWSEAVLLHQERAEKELGVSFHYPEQAEFAKLVQPLHQEMKDRGGLYSDLMERIEKTR